MPRLGIRRRKFRANGSGDIHVITFDGFIDAATVANFDATLEEHSRMDSPSLVLDFGKVEYINSSGIGAIVKHYHLAKERGGELVVSNVTRDVGLTMHMLGVTAFVPFLKDPKAAIVYFREPRKEGYYDHLLEAKGIQKGERRVKYRLPFRVKARTPPSGAAILMVVRRPDVFTDVMKLRLHDPDSGRFMVFTDCSDALRFLKETPPDVVVVEDRVRGAEEFLSQVKLERGRSMTSVIKLYPRETDLDGLRDFKIWENDYLREPFEVMQLFRLCESEIKRVPRDREHYLHQVRFQFRSSPENVDKAKSLAEDIIERCQFQGDAALGLKSAFKEAIDNAVMHGNRNDESKSVDVTFLMQSDRVTIEVQDEGGGFDHESLQRRLKETKAFEKAKRQIIEKGKRGGLGILLIRKCMDKVEFIGSGNIIRMEMALR